MSKRKESKKTAVFELEPDGFSIHTFELSMRLTGHEYHHIKDTLYRKQEGKKGKADIYREDEGLHRYKKFEGNGVRVRLEHNRSKQKHNQEKKQFDTYFLRLVINPRVLIEPGCSYLGILPPKKSSIKKLQNAFAELLEGTVFDNDLESYYLSRVDLCTNIRCDNKKLFRELIRVLRKLPTPPKYERKIRKDEDKKKANRYNKHYLRFTCGTHELAIYDKTYQVRNENLAIAYEKLPEGVLRFEVHCGRPYIQRIEDKSTEKGTVKMLQLMMKESENRIIDHFSRCFPDVEFVQMGELEHRIKKSGFKKENKDTMLELASRLQRLQSVDKALKQMEAEKYDVSGLLDRFTKLGISPIPLWKKFCAESLPGPVELLRAISEGNVTVEYVKAKYK